MTHYCAVCGFWGALDKLTFWCAKCFGAWRERIQAVKGE
jgi:hypothetical protein